MSDPRDGLELPPDLPPEYAEAYRQGYERALRASAPAHRPDTPDPSLVEVRAERASKPSARPHTPDLQSSGEFRISGPLFADEVPEPPGDGPDTSAPDGQTVPTHRADPSDGDRPPWLAPAMLAALVVILLLGAYVVGRAFSTSLSSTDAAPEEPDGVSIGDATDSAEPSEAGSPTPSKEPASPKPVKKYAGETSAAPIGGAKASCETAPSVDAAGNRVRYTASNVYDQDLTTAWRCDGDGVGETLRLDLPDTTRIGEIGLVPGYAKTDARSGVDRYAENNRLTKVRWTFADGTSVVQELDPDPDERDLQSVRIPVERTDEVTLEILGSTGGDRDTVAVSELRLGRTAD